MYKILVFGMTENPGGVESVIINYYRAIDKEKFQFDFLCNSYEKVAYEDELISYGAKTIHFPARSQDVVEYKKQLEQFYKEHAHEYEAIWVNICSLANIDYLKLAKKYGIKKRIIHSHNSQNMDSKLRGLLHAYNKMNLQKYATDYWACSYEAADWFFKPGLKEKSVQIHNAISLNKMAFDEEKRNKHRKELNWEDKFVIGNIGRFHFQKNQLFLLEIFAALEKIMPDARLVLIGQGEDEPALKQKAEQLNLMDKVCFAGLQYDIQGWLSAFDFFLFPSVFEGLPLVSLEAQANGVIMLASDTAVPTQARINPNFAVYELSENAEAWAKKVADMREHTSRIASEQIKENFVRMGFDIDTEVKKLENLFLND